MPPEGLRVWFFQQPPLYTSMIKGPLVYAAVALATILIAMSFLVVAFPDMVDAIGIVSAVVAVLVIAVLVAMLVKTRRETR